MTVFLNLKKPSLCIDDVTYHVTPPAQCNGLVKNKSSYRMGFKILSTALHSTASTTMQRHYSTAFLSSVLPQLPCTASSLLQFTSLHCTHYTALHWLYNLHCTTTTPLHVTALQSHYTEFHCTASTTLHAHYYSTALRCTARPVLDCILHDSTALHPLHCTHLLNCSVVTIHQYHPHYSTALPCYSTALQLALQRTLRQHWKPLHFTAWCSTIHYTVYHNISLEPHSTAFYCTVQCFTRHFTSTSLHCTILHGVVHFTILPPIKMRFILYL